MFKTTKMFSFINSIHLNSIDAKISIPTLTPLFSFFHRFAETLEEITSGKRSVTMILDDPAGNSYVQALTDDGSLDERLTIERYDRSFEQNEELGLNDMKTENYT